MSSRFFNIFQEVQVQQGLWKRTPGEDQEKISVSQLFTFTHIINGTFILLQAEFSGLLRHVNAHLCEVTHQDADDQLFHRDNLQMITSCSKSI